MKEQYEADSDRQLAMYSVWVRDKFKEAKSVKLVWHMLAFNTEVISERTPEQLEALKSSVVDQIKKIEEATKSNNFPTNVTPLCNYCLFRHLCPAFANVKPN
jgi:CRISPR/Cas system-associated exonuclease Cas4 (RecB family)